MLVESKQYIIMNKFMCWCSHVYLLLCNIRSGTAFSHSITAHTIYERITIAFIIFLRCTWVSTDGTTSTIASTIDNSCHISAFPRCRWAILARMSVLSDAALSVKGRSIAGLTDSLFACIRIHKYKCWG